MPTPTHDVFRVLLQIGDRDSIWTFRFYDDNTLQIQIESEGDSTTQPLDISHSTTHAFDEHIDVSYVATECVVKPPDQTTHAPGSYTCDFHLVQRVDGDQYVAYTAIEKVTASLSFEQGLRCELDYGEIHKDERAFDTLDQALEVPLPLNATVEPVRAVLYPLTCGSYTLKGGLMNYETGFHAPIIMRIELLIGGELTGTGFSFPLHPTMELFGFRGRVTKYAFMGVYVYDDQTFEEQEDEEIQSAVLWVTRMRRVWSREAHVLFPDQFNMAVRWLLLSSLRPSEARTMRLPSALWPRVLEYCDSQWFA